MPGKPGENRDVSIHAPARGATRRPVVAAVLPSFQSTRPRGARPSNTSVFTLTDGFNPRARAGRDCQECQTTLEIQCFNPRARAGRDDFERQQGLISLVSIHAPARGATFFSVLLGSVLRVSIHAPARGATVKSRDAYRFICCFNPRARAGRDLGPGVCRNCR